MTGGKSDRWAGVMALLRRGKPAPAPVPKPEPEAPRPPSELGLADFEREISRRLLNKQPGLLGGRVHFVNLGLIRERLGAAWDRYVETVHAKTRSVIERHLTDADVFTKVNNDQYLILFTRLSEDEARLKCALIGREIEQQILGEDGRAAGVVIRTTVSRLDGEVEVEEVDQDELIARFAQETAAPATASTPESPSETWEEVIAPGRGASVQTLFRPVWHVPRRMVTTYHCVPVSVSGDGRLLTRSLDDEEEVARIDLAVLERAVALITTVAKGGGKLLAACAVNFTTLARVKSRRAYVRALQTLPEQLRRLLVLEVTGLSQGVPQTQISSVLQFAKPFCRALMVRIPFQGFALERLSHTGVVAVGCDVSLQSLPEAELIAGMEAFVEAAEGKDFSTYVVELTSISMVTAAVCAGFRYAAGDAVAPVVRAPSQIMPFDLERIYAQLGARPASA